MFERCELKEIKQNYRLSYLREDSRLTENINNWQKQNLTIIN